MKTCSWCTQPKPLFAFNKCVRAADGLQWNCRACSNARIKARRKKHREQYKPAARAWRMAHLEQVRENSAKYRGANPVKVKAARVVAYALKKDDLVRKPCVECGALKADAHHPDYFKPLDIIWLCHQHHCDWHQANGPGLNG